MQDKELIAYRHTIGIEEYTKQYRTLYQQGKSKEKRYSGKVYQNSKTKLDSLREKYKNGVSQSTINQMLGIKE